MDKTILIIDDDNRNIFALTAVLKSRGYKVLSAAGMDEAFILLNNQPDIGIILLDMMMPGMDGYQALSHLKQDSKYAALPVIAVTAQAMLGDREKCLAAGADEYLPKPVDVDQLSAILARIE